MINHYRSAIACVWWSLFLACGFVGCDQLTSSRYSQLMQDADAKSEQGNFERAINLYEAALDDSPRCAEIHYKLALLYDDKLNDPVSALHHFRRCLALSPNGAHANDVKIYKSSARWEKILGANKESIRDPAKLTVGQSLVIP